MKTSIIVSTIILLYSLAIFTGTPSQQYDENKNETVCSYSITPTPLLTVMMPGNMVTCKKKEYAVKKVAPIIEDFRYLKFEVDNYMGNIEMPEINNVENTFGYLKFIVPQSAACNELSSDKIQLPVNEFEYLKFCVGNYSDNPDSNRM